MSTPLIEVKNLNFSYPDQEQLVLKDVNFKLQAGEFVAILGHNGSGKSSLVKMFNALLLPVSGDVWINGINTKEDNRIFEIRKTIGMVFQNPDNQMVAATVEDDLAFGLENIALPAEEMAERIDTALLAVDMLEFKERPPHHLSGGQKQRVAIASILAMQPQCIVFDESTAMLDPHGRKEVLEVLGNLKAMGIAVVLITHFAEEAMLADRVVVMNQGQIVLAGQPQEIFQQVDILHRLKLEVPLSIKIAKELEKKGINLNSVSDRKQLIEAICQYNSNQ